MVRGFLIKERAFSLVELLVVLAVIAMLATMILAALIPTQQNAQASECMSNLRQLALANLAYAADNNAQYVAAQDSRNMVRWHGVRTSGKTAFDPNKGPLSSYLGTEGRVKLCPTFRDALTGKNSFEQGTGGYGYNATYIGGTPTDYYSGERLSNVPLQALTVMFTDTAFARAGGVQEYPYCEPFEWVDSAGRLSGALSASVHFRHNAKAHVAWCDGHLSAEAPSKIDGSNYYGGNASKWAIGWFGPSAENGDWNPRREKAQP
jgi:prepilin-type N-terminal cleavage/methylation domain-containing protein/prepilin-type processing-associated H-X9-DG protein